MAQDNAANTPGAKPAGPPDIANPKPPQTHDAAGVTGSNAGEAGRGETGTEAAAGTSGQRAQGATGATGATGGEKQFGDVAAVREGKFPGGRPEQRTP